ncbi:hypothetical protein [Deinococcus sp. QL22]|uniref:hypothetical protein n=1 Tax=Deinococcus sp. QL22 TaxID=2939437 RepID=UPI002016CC0A|nr:hypothetical protein [Deinococcus sp. QL22]UQN10399.1 hypothetical protein M1R55_30055 [Deinococcus sp. QL22]UQN10533.1 hypothetical protein M1R55_29380 [Deinococcus sp. QL22]
MTTLREFNAAMQGLVDAPLSQLNAQLDQFLDDLTRRITVHRLRASLPIILAPRPPLSLRQRRRLKRIILRELRQQCRVRR